MKLFAFFKERPLVTWALFYGLGILIGYETVFVPALTGAGILLSLVTAFFLHRGRYTMLPGLCALALFLGIFITGMAVSIPAPREGKYTVTGSVSGSVRTDENTGKIKTFLTDVCLTDEEGRQEKRGKAYFTYTPDEGEYVFLSDGSRVSLNATVYLPTEESNLYGFDFRQYLLQKQVSFGISGWGGLTVTGQESNGISSVLFRLRENMLSKCRAVFGEESALPSALLLGYRDDLPDETRSAFSDAGVSHILAVSGLHVTMLAGFLMLLFRPFHLSPRAKLAIITAFLAFYCVIVDFSAPVLRASVLTEMGLIAVIARRRGDPLTNLSAAFIIILLFRPLDLFSASFILSFSAVLGIILFGDLFSSVQIRIAWLNPAWLFWRTTFAATLGVTLPVILFFHSFSLLGLVINPFVCLFLTVLLPMYAVVYVLGLIYMPIGTFLGSLVGNVTHAFTRVIGFLSDLPYASIRSASPGPIAVLLIIIVLILITRYVLISKRLKRYICIGCTVMLICVLTLFQDRRVRYVQLDMGQEDCAVITDGRETVVMDTGQTGGDLCSYLLSFGLQADHLFITHLHADHTGGIKSLIDSGIPVGCVYLPVDAEKYGSASAKEMLSLLQQNGVPVVYVARGDVLQLCGADFHILWPERDRMNQGADANTYALATLIDFDGIRLLHMSDVSGTYEDYFAEEADILKVSHHGSRTSTGTAFLSVVKPETAIITCSGRSAYLPSSVTLENLADIGARIFTSDLAGAIEIRFDHDSYIVKTYRGVP